MKKSVIYILYLSLFIGILCIFLGWNISFNKAGLSFNLDNLWKIHLINPFLWVINLIPIIFVLLIIKISEALNIAENEVISTKTEHNQQTSNIEAVANFAEKIGDGKFEEQFEISENADAHSDSLSQKILDLRDKLYQNNREEKKKNWKMSGKERISRLINLHTDIDELSHAVLIDLISYLNIIQGAFYVYDNSSETLFMRACYAYNRKKHISMNYKIGEGLPGQAAFEKDIIYRTEIPDDYVTISSGILGDKKPESILLCPYIAEKKLQGVLEFASLDTFSETEIEFIEEIGEIVARAIYNLKINEKTEKLLTESRELTSNLKENEEELTQQTEEMRATQEEIRETNIQLESQIKEVEHSQKRLHALLENASEVISIFDKNGIVKYESPSISNILGNEEENIAINNEYGRIHSSENSKMKEALENLLKDPKTPQTFEIKYRKRDNSVIWLETSGRNFLSNPSIKGIIFNTSDITQHKLAEKEQRKRGEMQALSENSPDMIIRINLEGRFFYVNPVVETYTGVSINKYIKNDLENIELPETTKDFFRVIIEQVNNSKEKIIEEFSFNSILGLRTMTVNAIPEFASDISLEDENDSDNKENIKIIETILIVAHDITERNKILLDIEHKNKNITESINYAERIQGSILPDSDTVRRFLPQSFIFFKAKDVVSGDFPWCFQKGDYIFIAAVDCTGHGVPGALLSLIGHFSLVNVVDHDREFNAAQVLDLMHQKVRIALKQESENAEARDGMDVALCVINTKKKIMHYAGAHRPLYCLQNGELIQYKGDRKAIGGIPLRKKKEKDFTNFEIKIQKGDKFFIFSDGLPDQLHHETKRKYSPKRIRDAITENSSFTMPKFSNYFAKDINKWMGDSKQIDDMLLIGFEVN